MYCTVNIYTYVGSHKKVLFWTIHPESSRPIVKLGPIGFRTIVGPTSKIPYMRVHYQMGRKGLIGTNARRSLAKIFPFFFFNPICTSLLVFRSSIDPDESSSGQMDPLEVKESSPLTKFETEISVEGNWRSTILTNLARSMS